MYAIGPALPGSGNITNTRLTTMFALIPDTPSLQGG
jgi:hypothetical protein